MYEHNALGYRSGLALCLTKVRSSRARCPATALIFNELLFLARLHEVHRAIVVTSVVRVYVYVYVRVTLSVKVF